MRLSVAGVISVLPVLCLSTGCVSAPGGEPWLARPDAAGVTFSDANRQLMRYRFGDVPFKPYVESLHTPSGVNILRDAPADHLHHHALMFAVNVGNTEFWGEAKSPGTQKPRYLQLIPPHREKDLYKTGLVQTLEWLGPDQAMLLQEKRTIEAWRAADLGASLICWQSVLHTPPNRDAVELTGREYFGLGARFVKSMDTGGRFFNADGGEGVQATKDVPSRWCAYSAAADGHPVTLAMFDHPDNPRHPSRWYTKDELFAYLTASPGLQHGPIILTKAKPLRFRYGVAVWDGTVEAKRVESLYRRWVRLPVAQ